MIYLDIINLSNADTANLDIINVNNVNSYKKFITQF